MSLKADVSSINPSSEQIEELWIAGLLKTNIVISSQLTC